MQRKRFKSNLANLFHFKSAGLRKTDPLAGQTFVRGGRKSATMAAWAISSI
jgi:hypothetical protein